MIQGLGIDVVSIGRIERAMRKDRFLDRVLTPLERQEARGPAWVAGRWAAKEAVIKALGHPVPLHEIEIVRGPLGGPVARVMAAAGAVVHVSISHERDTAVAVAIVERPDY